MEYFTEQEFRNTTRWFSLNEQRMQANNALNAPINTEYDVFLSYNIADIEIVKGIYYALRKEGLKVYLDVIVDPSLDRNSTNKLTAEIIRKRLEHSKSIIYAESPNANKSNWMPWEIGVVDGKKGKCMVLLLSDNRGNVPSKREYLLLYPTIHPQGLSRFIRVVRDDYSYPISTYIR